MHTSSIGPLDGNLVLRTLEHSATQLPRGGDAAPRIRINKLPDLYNVSRIHELYFLAKARAAADRSFARYVERHAALTSISRVKNWIWKSEEPLVNIYKRYQQYLGITRLDADKERELGCGYEPRSLSKNR